MPDDKKTFKEKRQERQQGRVDKLIKERQAEAKTAGVDLGTPSDIGPLGSERKARIDKTLQKGVREDLLGGLKKIQDVRKAPEVDIAEKPALDLDIKDVRKERRAKIANIMNAFGQGLAGEQVDAFKYTRPLKEDRLAQYQQYKDTTKAAKQRLDEWETGYINEQLEYLETIRDNPKTSDLKRQQIQAQIERINAQTAQTKAKTRQIGKDDKVPTAKVVRKVGDDETISRNIPISEAKEIERQSQIDKATSGIDMELSQAKLELADMGEKWTPGSGAFYVRNKANLEAKISQLEQQRQEIIDEFNGETISPSTTEDDIWSN